MTAAVSTTEDRARLLSLAREWIGTPYCADGAVKGSGVSCSMLPYAILHAYGHTMQRPTARKDMPKVSIFRFMLDCLNAATDFAPVELSAIQPGDIALVDIGMGHALLAADETHFIHCWAKGGTQLVSIDDPAIRKRIRGAWRPVV